MSIITLAARAALCRRRRNASGGPPAGLPAIGPLKGPVFTLANNDTVLADSTSTWAAATTLTDLLNWFGAGNYSASFWQFADDVDGTGYTGLRADVQKWPTTTLTQDIVASGTAQTFTVGSTAGMDSTPSAGQSLNIGYGTANSETVSAGNWTKVSATQISCICTKNHANGDPLGCGLDRGYVATKNFSIKPVEAYVRVRYRAGRTPTGGGIGAIPASVGDNSQNTYVNTLDGDNSGVKRVLLLRDYVTGDGRLYLKFANTPDPTAGAYCDNLNIAVGENTGHLNLDGFWGGDVDIVMYFKRASTGTPVLSDGTRTADGTLKVWINGTKLLDFDPNNSPANGLAFGNSGIAAVQFPATFRSPRYDTSEYYTDIQAWIPGVPGVPNAPTSGTPTATQTTLTYPVTAASTGGTPQYVHAEVYDSGTATWVAHTEQVWTAPYGGTQNVRIQGLQPATNYTNNIRFVLRNYTGSSAPSATVASGTTVTPGTRPALTSTANGHVWGGDLSTAATDTDIRNTLKQGGAMFLYPSSGSTFTRAVDAYWGAIARATPDGLVEGYWDTPHTAYPSHRLRIVVRFIKYVGTDLINRRLLQITAPTSPSSYHKYLVASTGALQLVTGGTGLGDSAASSATFADTLTNGDWHELIYESVVNADNTITFQCYMNDPGAARTSIISKTTVGAPGNVGFNFQSLFSQSTTPSGGHWEMALVELCNAKDGTGAVIPIANLGT